MLKGNQTFAQKGLYQPAGSDVSAIHDFHKVRQWLQALIVNMEEMPFSADKIKMEHITQEPVISASHVKETLSI